MDPIRAVFEDGIAGNQDGRCDVTASDPASPLQAIMSVARETLGRFCTDGIGAAPVFKKGRIAVGSMAQSISVLADQLLRAHPTRVEPGFEGNAGISGGAWRNDDDEGDALVYLRFSEGTVDLPLHVHEFSDRFIAVAEGSGLFHYMPAGENCGELRSVVVQAGDVVVFTRGLVHTFTAPIAELVLLSYHAPFLAFGDARQFRIPRDPCDRRFVWSPGQLVRPVTEDATIGSVTPIGRR